MFFLLFSLYFFLIRLVFSGNTIVCSQSISYIFRAFITFYLWRKTNILFQQKTNRSFLLLYLIFNSNFNINSATMTILRINKRLLLQSGDFEDIVLIIRIKTKKKLIFQISGIEQISHLTRFVLLMTIIICFSFNGFFLCSSDRHWYLNSNLDC